MSDSRKPVEEQGPVRHSPSCGMWVVGGHCTCSGEAVAEPSREEKCPHGALAWTKSCSHCKVAQLEREIAEKDKQAANGDRAFDIMGQAR
jgi:hypothetical protein